jgi:uncharacterized protein (TIRG00374 family)
VTGGGRARARGPFLDWKGVVGILISVGLLWYAFRDVHLAEVWEQVRKADLGLLALAGLLATVPFPFRAIRWKPLLRPSCPGTRFRPRFAATTIGFMVNNLLPARVGEFVRAYALSRIEPVRVSASFGSLVVERLFDGMTVVALLFLALAWPGFPDLSGRDFGTAALWMGGVFAAGLALLVGTVAFPRPAVRLFETAARVLPRAIRRPVVDALEAFLDGLGALRDWRLVLQVVAWSGVIWLVGGLAFWVGLLAFDIRVPFVAAVFLQSVIALAVAVPSAPGFFGVFEAAARVGLVQVWGVATGPALAFAIGFHLAGFIPVTVIGLYYLWRLGFSWRDVEVSEEAVETAVEGAPATGRGPGP